MTRMTADARANAALDEMERWPETSRQYRLAEQYILNMSAGAMLQCRTTTLARMTGVTLEEYERLVAEERAKGVEAIKPITLEDLGL